MRAVSPPLVTLVGQAITTPGYLVEIAFSAPYRASSRGNLRFGGSPFNAAAVTVGNLSSANRGALAFLDPDRTLQAYILQEGVAEKRTRVWLFYGDVAEFSDVEIWNPMLLFDGYVDRCAIDTSADQVTLQLLSAAGVTEYVPRTRIIKENGFNWLPQAGLTIEFGGEKFVLQPDTGD